MKNLIKYTFFFLVVLLISCNKSIDPITKITPEQDTSAPVVKINKPLENFQIQVPETVTSVNIDFKVTDDIEIVSVVVDIDGETVADYTSFKDYRIFMIDDLKYDNVTTGSHILTITAIDVDGKTTKQSVNFEKAPPYTPLYNGEIFYMPFNGDYMELVSLKEATIKGNPTLSSNAIGGSGSYKGATESYLTLPTNGLLDSKEFSVAFWYNMSIDPKKSGIITIAPVDDAVDPNRQSNIDYGLRIFRDGVNGKDLRLNVGSGTEGTNRNYGNTIVTPSDWFFVTATISTTECTVYINGLKMKTIALKAPIDWGDTKLLSIGSGSPSFTAYGHLSDLNLIDELRMFNKTLSQSEIKTMMLYQSKQTLYMPFNGDYKDKVTDIESKQIGSPNFAEGKFGNAYQGNIDSYITMPTNNFSSDEFTATFWYKLNDTPDRAGILIAGPLDDNNPSAMNNRKHGFRFFREKAGSSQRFKLNVGTGDADVWIDGGNNADIDPTADEWVFLAISISSDKAAVYINGNLAKETSMLEPISWQGCDILSIMSGAPRFTGWGHKSDLSLMDDLRIFNKALTQEEILNLAQ